MRQILGVVLACVLASSCSADSSPTTPTSAPAAGVPTSLTLELDRQTIPHTDLGGAVMASVTIAVQPGTSLAGVPVQFVMTMQGVDTPTSDVVLTNAEGRVTKQFNFARAGTLAVSTGGLSQSAAVSRQAAPPPAEPPPPVIPPPTPAPPPPGPSLSVALAVSRASTDTVTPVTFTATATTNNGAAAATSYAWDFDGNGTTDATTTTSSTSHTYLTTGSKSARVTATNGAQSASSSLVSVSVSAPGVAVTLAASASSVRINENVTFTATLSSTTGNLPTDVQWAWDTSGTGTGAFVAGSATRVASFAAVDSTTSVRVRATSATAGEVIGSATIAVTAPALLVSLSSTANPAAGGNVTFTATVTVEDGSTPPSGLTYQWSDDGSGDETYEASTGTTNTRTTSFGSTGTKIVRVKVTDPASGLTATTTRTITVS